MNPTDERSNDNPGQLSTGFVDQPVTPTGGQRAVNWRKPGFFAIGAVVVVLLIVGGVYLGFTRGQPTPDSPQISTIDDQPPLLETKDWSTYTNSQGHFSIRYPPA